MLQRVLSPVLVGRQQELSQLEDALLSVNRGDGRFVLLAGEAGMGKTRLATELTKRARKLGLPTARARPCFGGGGRLPGMSPGNDLHDIVYDTATHIGIALGRVDEAVELGRGAADEAQAAYRLRAAVPTSAR
jgi:hypothetical protein